MSIKYNGYNSHCLTMENTNAVPGSLVAIDKSGRAYHASNGDKFIGVCVSVREKKAVVQTHGYISHAYQEKPTYGVGSFCVGTNNTLLCSNIDAGGRPAIVLEIDETNKTAGIILC